MRAFPGSVLEWCGRAVAARLLPQQPPSGWPATGRTLAEAAPAAAPSRPGNRLKAGQQPPRGRTDAAVASRMLPAVPAWPNGSWPVSERILRPGCRGRVSRVLLRQEPPSRGRSWAGAALPRQGLGRSCPPEAGAGQEPPSRGRSRAAAAAATAGRARLPQRFPGQQPPEPSRSRGRLLPGGGAVPARRGGGCRETAGRLAPASGGRLLRVSRGGCCPAAGRLPPRSGGCCAAPGQQPAAPLSGAGPPLWPCFLAV